MVSWISVGSDQTALVMMRRRNRQWRWRLGLLLFCLQEKLLSRLEVKTLEHLVRWLRHQVVHQPRVDNRRVWAPQDDGDVGDWVIWRNHLGAHQDWGTWQQANLSKYLVHTEETWH